MPQETNRVDLDPTVKDAWGLPVARITNSPHQNDIAMSKWQIDKNVEILEAAGARRTDARSTSTRLTGNTCHQHGTVRMGIDPSKSVLNEWGQAHDVENLFVARRIGLPDRHGRQPDVDDDGHSWRCG